MLKAPERLSRGAGSVVGFGDVARNCTRATSASEAGIERYVGLEHLEPGSLVIERWGDVGDGTTFTRRFDPGQVLFGKRRAYQRKAAVAGFTGVCSGDILVFEATERLLPELLPFIVGSDAFVEHALKTSAGSLSPRTRWKDLAEFSLVLPTMEVQERAVRLLLSVERCIADFRRVGDAASIAARALVADAVGDHLWSDRWPRTTVADIGDLGRQPVQVGPFGGTLASRHFTLADTPVLKINNITEHGRLALDDLIYVAPEYAETLARYALREGDLVTAAQATVGRSALVPREAAGALISQHLIRVAIDTGRCLPQYLLACFQSPLIKRQMSAVKAKTTRDGLNTADVASFLFPLPSVPEQRALVSQIDRVEAFRHANEVRLTDTLRVRTGIVEHFLGTTS